MRIAVEENHPQATSVSRIRRNDRGTLPKEAQNQIHGPKRQTEEEGDDELQTSTEQDGDLLREAPRADGFVANEGGVGEGRVEHGEGLVPQIGFMQ